MYKYCSERVVHFHKLFRPNKTQNDFFPKQISSRTSCCRLQIGQRFWHVVIPPSHQTPIALRSHHVRRAWRKRVERSRSTVRSYCDRGRSWCSHHERGERRQTLSMFKTSVVRAWQKNSAVRAWLERIRDGESVVST